MILNIGAHGYDKMTSSELKSGLNMILICVELWKMKESLVWPIKI